MFYQASFIPYDLEAAFVAATNLLLGPAVDPKYVARSSSWLNKAYAVLDDMINHGNLIAEYRKNELLQVDALLGQAANGISSKPGGDTTSPGDMVSSEDRAVGGGVMTSFFDEAPSSVLDTDAIDDLGIFETGYTREEILGVVDAIDDADVAWMCDTIVDQSMW